MKCKILIKLLLAAMICSFVGCSKPAEEQANSDDAQTKTIPPVDVDVQEIVPVKSLADSFLLHAKVEPNRIVRLSAEVPGRVEKIAFQEGSLITNDQLVKPILMIKDDLIKAEYDQAKAQAHFNQLEYNRIDQLLKKNVATENEVDKARTALETSQALLQQQKGRLERTKIYPPITGTLNDISVELGEFVQPGTPVAEIVDSETVKVVANIPERDIPFLNVGDQVAVMYSYMGMQSTQDAKISLISKLSHPKALTTRIEILVDNEEKRFFNGQVLKVLFTRRVIKDAIMIPMEVVIPLEHAKAVYVVEDGKAVRKEVKLGFIRGRSVQVTQGLETGDLLISKGQRYVSNGQDVTIIKKTRGNTIPNTSSALLR